MYECFNDWDWFTVVAYVASFTALFAALYLEYKDLFCENGKCKVGNGASYVHGKPKKDDSFNTLLSKIRISSKYDEASVYWRRVIIFTVITLYILLLLVLQRLPNGYEILVSFATLYLLTFLSLVYYQEVVSKPATKQVNKATKLLHDYHK